MALISDGYPVVLRLDGRRVLVVGAGPVAARKLGALLSAGAAVTIVAPLVVDDIRTLAAAGRVTVFERRYAASDLDGVQLVIVSTNDATVQRQVFDDCEAEGIWCNAADDPDNCSFILPAVTRRGPVIVAVSTQGSSPALAGVLRDIVTGALPANVEAVAAQLGSERAVMRSAGRSTESVDWRPRVQALLSSRPPDELARVDKSDTSSASVFRDASVEEAVDEQDQG